MLNFLQNTACILNQAQWDITSKMSFFHLAWRGVNWKT